MPERGIYRGTAVRGYATTTNAPLRVNPTGNYAAMVPAGTGSTEVPFVMAATASGYRIAGGSGALVSGTATIATGLSTVLAFSAEMSGSTGFATGATEVSGILVGAITTGSVVITGTFNQFTTGNVSLSASGTGTFTWLAIGT